MRGLATPATGQHSRMSPDSSRLDPLAPIAAALVLLPFLTGLLVDSVALPWRLVTALAGSGLGLVSLVRIRDAGGRLRGRRLALAAVIAGLGLAAVGMLVLAVVLAIFVATGSS